MSESESYVDLFGGPLSHEVPDQSASRRCSKSWDDQTQKDVRTQLSDPDLASDESDTDEKNAQITAPQTENSWLKESISEIKSLISSLSQKVDRNK